MCDRYVGSAVVRKRLHVAHRLLRETAEDVVNVLVQERYADLGIVDEIVGVLLPHAKAEFAGSKRDVAPELELRIAFGLEVELRGRRLKREIEQLRGSR